MSLVRKALLYACIFALVSQIWYQIIIFDKVPHQKEQQDTRRSESVVESKSLRQGRGKSLLLSEEAWLNISPLRDWKNDTRSSTIFVRACCGLGHRLSRLMKTYTYAKSRGRRIVVFWGACGTTGISNIYNEMFNDEKGELEGLIDGVTPFYSEKCKQNKCKDRTEWTLVTDPRNESSKDKLLENYAPKNWFPPSMALHQAKLENRLKTQAPSGKEWEIALAHREVAPYATRFAQLMLKNLKPQWRSQLDKYLQTEFSEIEVIACHFRFGNGEVFGRQPKNMTLVIQRAATAIRQMSTVFKIQPFRVYLATDDISALDLFKQIAPDFDIFTRPQWRAPPGTGISFSSWRPKRVTNAKHQDSALAKITQNASNCIQSAIDMLIDSLLLGLSDAMLLTVPSTFSVLPKAIALARQAPICGFFHTAWSAVDQTVLKDAKISFDLTCFRQLEKYRLVTTKIPFPRNPLSETEDDPFAAQWHLPD